MVTKLSGHESSVLAFIAERPNELPKFAHTLEPGALLIAQYLANIKQHYSDEVIETGEAIRSWSRERALREQL